MGLEKPDHICHSFGILPGRGRNQSLLLASLTNYRSEVIQACSETGNQNSEEDLIGTEFSPHAKPLIL